MPPSPWVATAPTAAPAGVKPPLARRKRRAATLAGALLFPVISLGWTLIVASIAAGSGIAFLDAFAAQDTGSVALEDAVATIHRIALPLVIVAAVLGTVLWVLGLLLSRVVLRRSGHPRPWAVTWLGLLIAAAVSTLVDGVVAGIVDLAVSAIGGSGLAGTSDVDDLAGTLGDVLTGVIGGAIVWFAVAIGVAVGSGILGWRWMAWALRSATADDAAANPTLGAASAGVPVAGAPVAGGWPTAPAVTVPTVGPGESVIPATPAAPAQPVAPGHAVEVDPPSPGQLSAPATPTAPAPHVHPLAPVDPNAPPAGPEAVR